MDQETKSKEYIRGMSPTWWLQRWPYTKFMIRDITSVFIAGYCVFLMILLYRATEGTADFLRFYESLRSPISLVLHGIALIFAVIHSITFFNLTPRAIVVFRGDEKLPESVIVGLHYGMWVVATGVLVLIALW